jgi:hypothetical protein
MRRAALLLVAVAFLTACGSSSKTSSPSADAVTDAREQINAACVQFAQTFLSTDPNSGIPQMNIRDASAAISQAATTARSAAQSDPTWTNASHALASLSKAMALQDNKQMATALPAVRQACTPVIAAIPTTTG